MCISLSFCLVSIRFSLGIRRKARLAGTGTQPDVTARTRNPEKPAVHSDDHLQPLSLYPIPERSKSQWGREREPPVIIGDPADANVSVQGSMRKSMSRTSVRQTEYTPQVATPKSSRQSTRRSTHGPDDVPSRNSSDLRTIPLIPQEVSEDMLFAPSPTHSQSSSQSQPPPHPTTPTHPPAHTLSYP